VTDKTPKVQTPNKQQDPKSKFCVLELGFLWRLALLNYGVFHHDIDNPRIHRHHFRPMNPTAAFFGFSFAGYFAPQIRGGLSRRNV
jgi:hypothetical protein